MIIRTDILGMISGTAQRHFSFLKQLGTGKDGEKKGGIGHSVPGGMWGVIAL